MPEMIATNIVVCIVAIVFGVGFWRVASAIPTNDEDLRERRDSDEQDHL